MPRKGIPQAIRRIQRLLCRPPRRKNGAGSLWSANLADWIYAILGTWSKNGINIRTALTDYLTVCVALGKAPDDLSPWLP